MSATPSVHFDSSDVVAYLSGASGTALDALAFGVIGFDAQGLVRRYNQFESAAAGLAPDKVLGHDLFSLVAPCMNNFMVAQRFVDASADGTALDDTVPYVLTLRMRPTKVRLRLLAAPDAALRFVLVQRAPRGTTT